MWANVRGANKYSRKQIDAVISGNPTVVNLERFGWVADGAGGKTKTGPLQLPAQLGMLVGTEATGTSPVRTTEDGRSVQAAYILVFNRKADVEVGDVFFSNDQRNEIVYIHADRSIAIRCEVIASGK